MKAEELRIGNWYNSFKFQVPVRCELVDFYELCAQSDGAYNDPPIEEMFYPIPLTEEWLLKFGFKKINHRTEGIIYQLRWLRLTEFYYADWRGSPIGIIKHVHQLQNLYFALTGEELTLKEDESQV